MLVAFHTTCRTEALLKGFRCALLLFSTLLVTESSLMAQNAMSDSVSTRAVLPVLYMRAVGGGASIYDGPEYTGSYPGIKGSPFFPNDHFTEGMLSFKGVAYYGISMAYDIVTDQVVIKSPQNLGIALLAEAIDSFVIDGHLFIRYVQEQKTESAPATGFYEVLHPAPMLLLAKRLKVTHRGLSAEDPMVFGQFNKYLVKKGRVFREITGRRALLSLFPGRRKEIRAYWKRRALKYKKDPETTIIETIQYFSQVTP